MLIFRLDCLHDCFHPAEQGRCLFDLDRLAELAEAGVLDELGGALIALFCQFQHRFQDVDEVLIRDGRLGKLHEGGRAFLVLRAAWCELVSLGEFALWGAADVSDWFGPLSFSALALATDATAADFCTAPSALVVAVGKSRFLVNHGFLFGADWIGIHLSISISRM